MPVSSLSGVVEVERLAEVLDRVPAPRLLAGLGDGREFIRRVGRNDHRRLQERDAPDQLRVRLRLDLLAVQPLGKRRRGCAFWYRIAASLEWHTTCALKPSGRMLSM